MAPVDGSGTVLFGIYGVRRQPSGTTHLVILFSKTFTAHYTVNPE